VHYGKKSTLEQYLQDLLQDLNTLFEVAEDMLQPLALV